MDANALDRTWFDEIETTQADHLKLDFATSLERAIAHADITRSDLARALEKSPAWVTKVLRGDENLTIETMCKLAEAIAHEVHIHMAPKDAAVRWFEAYGRVVVPEKRPETKGQQSWNKLLEGVHEHRIPAAA